MDRVSKLRLEKQLIIGKRFIQPQGTHQVREANPCACDNSPNSYNTVHDEVRTETSSGRYNVPQMKLFFSLDPVTRICKWFEALQSGSYDRLKAATSG